MKILFTGASSFTGFWFAKELAKAGHEVLATFRKHSADYQGVRAARMAALQDCCRPAFGLTFGSDEFVNLIQSERFDLLCHHAAEVSNYRSPDFDAADALVSNTRNIAAVLSALNSSAASAVLLTGTVFENDEGAGSEGLPAFSPYGLSKALTAQAFRHYARAARLPLGKFVIPNPFGPYEEPRFTSFLVKTWYAGQVASVQTPAYVRDNIHVTLLAKAYAQFAGRVTNCGEFIKTNPSGYVESQGAFALRFAREMSGRLGLACEVELKAQTEFPEPRIRINTDPADAASLNWNESAAWDELADYYRELYAKGSA